MKEEASTLGKQDERPFVSREPELREDFTETAFDLNMEMVYVEGGEFEMGATAEQQYSVSFDEYPVRTIRLDGYHIGKYVVTQAQWRAVMGTTLEEQWEKVDAEWSPAGKGDNYPMYCVNWEEAQEFCRRLSEKTGKRYVLPTEAQWEYAARGGKKSQHYEYAGSDDPNEVAWYPGNSYYGFDEEYPDHSTHLVGMKKANELGLYDMIGNVWEWCLDWYDGYDENDIDNRDWPAEDDFSVIRGGGWNTDAVDCRVSDRRSFYAGCHSRYLGFRVACFLGNDGENFTEMAFGLNMEMVYVEGGEFWQGATVKQGDAAYSFGQVRKVKLDGFHIGKYQVTQAQWEAVMGTNPSFFKGDNRPVENVSWFDAQEFCKKLSEATGRVYMLPTEEEWEYAARGGNKSRHYKYAGSDNIDEVAWYLENSDDAMMDWFFQQPVGKRKANELGLHDMSGNVGEWCSDWYGEYDENDTYNPQGPASGSFRVVRGAGGGDSYAEYCRVSSRDNIDSASRFSNLGFRVACIL